MSPCQPNRRQCPRPGSHARKRDHRNRHPVHTRLLLEGIHKVPSHIWRHRRRRWSHLTPRSLLSSPHSKHAHPPPDPCIGYIFRETSGPQRKLVILGDTHDPSAIIPLCLSPPPTLLIHEATDAHIPKQIDYNHRRTPEAVLEKALARGHSVPAMAGAFAKTIGAKNLVFNHIGARYLPNP